MLLNNADEWIEFWELTVISGFILCVGLFKS